MAADTTTRPFLTGADADRALLHSAFRRARRDGWTTRWSGNRHDGQWSWVSVDWPRRTRPPANARRMSWDGKVLTVQVINAHPYGWLTVFWARPASVRQAIWMLVAAGVLPEAMTR